MHKCLFTDSYKLSSVRLNGKVIEDDQNAAIAVKVLADKDDIELGRKGKSRREFQEILLSPSGKVQRYIQT